MNWQEIKASVAAFFHSFAQQFMQQEQPQLKPIPIQVDHRHPEQRRR
jgi:hypothetical protein